MIWLVVVWALSIYKTRPKWVDMVDRGRTIDGSVGMWHLEWMTCRMVIQEEFVEFAIQRKR